MLPPRPSFSTASQGVPGPPAGAAHGQPAADGAQTRQSLSQAPPPPPGAVPWYPGAAAQQGYSGANQAPSARSSQGQPPSFAVGPNPPLWPSKSSLKRTKQPLRLHHQTGRPPAPPPPRIQQQYQRRSSFLNDPDRQRALAGGGGPSMSMIPNLVTVGGIDLDSDDPDNPGRFLYAFNLQSNKWNAFDSSMRRYIHHHGVGMINGKLYVVGETLMITFFIILH